MARNEITQLFNFTDDDLRHNQSGMLSTAQAQRLTSVRRGGAAVMLVLIAAAVIGIFFFARQLIADPLPLTDSGTYWLGIIALAIMGGWLLVQVIRKPDHTVVQVRGPVQLVQHQSDAPDSTRGKITYEMWVGSERFVINESVFDSLADGQEMIVYYIRDRLRILSVEVKELDTVT